MEHSTQSEFDNQVTFSIPDSARSYPQTIHSIVTPQKDEAPRSQEGHIRSRAMARFFDSSKWMALQVLCIGLITIAGIAFPLQKVFSGEWKVHQTIDITSIESLQIGSRDWIIPFGEGEGVALYFETSGFPLSIRMYAAIIFLGLICGYMLALKLARKSHVATTIIDRMCIGLIVFGLMGARLFFVAFNWDVFSQNPENIILALPQGGLSIFGAIIGASLYLLAYVYRFKFNVWEFLDILAPAILLGQVIGRWGNFFNYESYGPATSVYWKMFVPTSVNFTGDISQNFFHPTFLYEIIPNFLLLILLLYVFDALTAKRSGLIFALYAMGYGLIRGVTELYRIDALTIDLPFSVSIWIFTITQIYISQLVALILAGIGYYTYMTRKNVFFIRKTLEEISVV